MQLKYKSKLFYNYLFSYIVILMVPLIILSVYFYAFFFKVMRKEALVNNTNVLYRAQNVIEEQLSQISDVRTQVSANKNLKYFYLQGYTQDAIMTINELNNYISLNPFVESILYYNRGDNFLFTQSSSVSLDLFTTSIYPFKNLSSEDFIKQINTAVVPSCRMEEVLLDGVTQRVMLYIYPIGTNYFSYDRTLCFIIPEKSFNNLLKDAVSDYSGFSIILDEYDNIITSNIPLTFDSELLSKTINMDETNFNRTVNLNGEKYLFSCIKSEINQWKYVTLVSGESIMKTVNLSFLVFGVIILLVISIGTVAIYYMMSLNYRPIKHLKIFTQKFSSGNNQNMNEIDSVKSTLEFLSSENEKLNIELESSGEATRDFLLSKVISGRMLDSPEFIEQCRSAGLSFNSSFFRIAVIFIKEFPSENIDLISLLTQADFPKDFILYSKPQTGSNSVILLMQYNELDINAAITALHTSLSGLTNHLITVGVGNPATQMRHISRSYIQAMTALDYRLIRGTGRVIFYDEIQVGDSPSLNSVRFIPDKLGVSIKEGDIESVNAIISEAVAFLKEKDPPITVARMLCFDITNAVAKAMHFLSRKQVLSTDVYPDVFALSEYETIDELSQIVQKISLDIHNFINSQGKSEELIDQILEYTSSVCYDCDFAIQQVADHFNLLLPNLSQYFKEKTGSNILDYCTNRKIERAKALLTSPTLPLKDIALQVGYYNVTSFIRRFKQITGMTPGEYRKGLDS